MFLKTDRKRIFSERLHRACLAHYGKEHGMATALADELGVTVQSTSKWMRGESMPGPERWGVIAAKLGVTTSWLIGDTHDDPAGMEAPPSDKSLDTARQAASIVFPLVMRLQPGAGQILIDELFVHAYEQLKAGHSQNAISGEIAARLL